MINSDTMGENSAELAGLFGRVRCYEKSDEYMSLLKFCAKFRHVSAYNGYLVNIQKPGAQYVLTERQWSKRYGRILCDNARPLIVLQPFGPINFVYDIGDTMFNPEIDERSLKRYEAELEYLKEPYKAEWNDFANYRYERLLSVLQYYGIRVGEMDAAAEYSGYISLKEQSGAKIQLDWENNVLYKSYYNLTINQKQSTAVNFVAVCHELAHLFCRHLDSPEGGRWWQSRSGLDHATKEFEAESVAWLVCGRLGLDCNSEKYLVNYLDENGRAPKINLDIIFKAVGEIEKMIFTSTYKDGLLYKKDKAFRQLVKKAQE